MKQVVYRNISGNNPRKHEISIEEVSDRISSHSQPMKGYKIVKKWVCKYFIKEEYSSSSVEDLHRWVGMKRREGCRKDCHVLRQFNNKTGENKIVCKVLGDFFIVAGRSAYKIVYVNELKIQMVA